MIDDGALVRRLGVLTETLHAVIYFAPEARAAYESAGLRGYWRGYFASRCAALGSVGPELASALLGGFAPSMVARALPMVWKLANPEDVVTARTSAATAALRRLVGGDLESVVAAGALTRRCITALDLPGRPMAAAHAALFRPTDPLGALWHDTTVLREHRGDGHLVAVAVAGLTWPEPHLLLGTRVDPAQQLHRGWSDAEWFTAAKRMRGHDPGELDAITDRLAAPAYTALTPNERLELTDLLEPLARTAATELPYPNAMGLLALGVPPP